MKMSFRLFIILIPVIILITSCEQTTPPTPIQIGQNYQGGIVFYVDGSGQHGYICATFDQSNGLGWSNGSNVLTNATNGAAGQGQNNSNAIIALQGNGNYAAKMCDTLTLGGYTDWFLPCQGELLLMFQNLKNQSLGNFANTEYWSSTEFDLNYALAKNFGDPVNSNGFDNKLKSDAWHVRAVRAF